MVDFSDALKAKIGAMSAEELAATEVRRLARNAELMAALTLDSLWEPLGSDSPVPTTKALTVQVYAGVPGSPDILRLDEGTTFHETILLGLPVYRLLAGGGDGGGSERFVVKPGGNGYDRVSVDRAELAAIMMRERPDDMVRAARLVALEQRSPVSQSATERVAHFEARWIAETVNTRIDAIVAKLSSRAVMLLAGRDHAALWVRKEDLMVGPGRILASPFAAAIVRPETHQARFDVLVPGSGAAGADAYLKNSFGSGPERSLILDVAQVRKTVAAMDSEEARGAALAFFEGLVDRSAAIGRERRSRRTTGLVRARAAQA